MSRLAARVERMRPSRLRELVAASTAGPVLSLGGGLPPPEAFPAEALAEAAGRVLARPDRLALQYPPTEGDPGLIDAIARVLGAGVGREASPQGVDVALVARQGVAVEQRHDGVPVLHRSNLL